MERSASRKEENMVVAKAGSGAKLLVGVVVPRREAADELCDELRGLGVEPRPIFPHLYGPEMIQCDALIVGGCADLPVGTRHEQSQRFGVQYERAEALRMPVVLASSIPILAFCRGMWLLTLSQHVAPLIPVPYRKMGEMPIEPVDGSWLQEALGDRLIVGRTTGWMLGRLIDPECTVVTATCADRVAAYDRRRGWISAIAWHPGPAELAGFLARVRPAQS
jgi:hypothetical protein